MKNCTALFLVSLLLMGSISFPAQPRRPGPPPPKFLEQSEEAKIIDPPNDFYESGLPEPLILGDNPSDALASKIARELAKYEENSLALLIAALQKTGFYIIDENQKILYKPTSGKGMGMAFYDFEVVGMLKLSRRGYITTLGKMAGLIGKELKQPAPQRLSELMLADMKAAANSSNKTKRFWARLIIEIGKNFPQPIDLMAATPENAQLNIIQASLWERRLIGDLITEAEKASGGMAFAPLQNRKRGLFRPEKENISFINASYSPAFAPDPCNYTAVESTQTDVAATAITTIHGKTLETVAEYGRLEGLGKVGAGIGIANLVLNWAKLVAAVSQMKGKITVEQPMPLIRTKSNRAPGEKRTLTGKFEIKVNDLRKLNCARLAINMVSGLDFSMPSSGPLSEKPVSWELGGEVSFKGQGSSQTGRFEQVVYLLPPDGANRDHHKQETDANGESKIYLEGQKQKEDLTNQKLVPMPKKATVRADVALKNMKDSKQESADVGGMALGFAIGGVTPIGILSALPELGFRMKIPVTSVSVPIRDWAPCTADWGGYFTYKREFSQTIVVKSSRRSNGNGTGDGIRKINQLDEANIELDPRTKEEIAAKKDPKPALIYARGKHSDIFEGLREADPCCGKEEGKFDTRFRQGSEETYSGTFRKQATIGFSGGERDYSLSMDFYSDPIKSERHEFLEILETNCGVDEGEAYSRDEEGSKFLQASLPPGRYGQRAINSEGELLFGEKVLAGQDGAKITWTWALARCKE